MQILSNWVYEWREKKNILKYYNYYILDSLENIVLSRPFYFKWYLNTRNTKSFKKLSPWLIVECNQNIQIILNTTQGNLLEIRSKDKLKFLF